MRPSFISGRGSGYPPYSSPPQNSHLQPGSPLPPRRLSQPVPQSKEERAALRGCAPQCSPARSHHFNSGPKVCCHVNKSSRRHGNQPDCSTTPRSGLFFPFFLVGAFSFVKFAEGLTMGGFRLLYQAAFHLNL